MAEKALKFAKKADRGWDEPEVDRSNMLLFPTIASCTSSDSEEMVETGDLSGGVDVSSRGDGTKIEDSDSLKRDSIAMKQGSTVAKEDSISAKPEPSQHTKHHHHRHRHRHHKQFLVSYQTHAKYSVISNAS